MSKIALVTGGSGAIGAACARKLIEAGYTVLVHYNKGEENARRTGAAEIYHADFESTSETQKMCTEILKKYKKIDLLVNAAGVSESGLFTDFTDAHIRKMLEVNLVSAMNTTRAFVPAMISEGRGTVINISSIWGISGAACEVVYSTAKAGLIGFTKALAKELGPSNVRVNCIAPGVIDTPMNKGLTEETIKELKNKTSLGKFGTPEDIADAVAFLANAEFITGQVLTVDGGFLD